MTKYPSKSKRIKRSLSHLMLTNLTSQINTKIENKHCKYKNCNGRKNDIGPAIEDDDIEVVGK
jgi:hypothetical protein